MEKVLPEPSLMEECTECQCRVHLPYAVLLAKLELLFPDTCIRVKEVETGAFLLQVVVQV